MLTRFITLTINNLAIPFMPCVMPCAMFWAIFCFDTGFAASAQMSPDELALGKQLVESHQPREALPHLERAVHLNPNDPNPYFWQGLALEETQQLRAAAQAYSKSIELARQQGLDSAALRVNLGNCMSHLNYVNEAIFDYQRAIEIEPKFVAAHLGLGRLLALIGQNQSALSEFEKCTELGYSDPSLSYLKAVALKNTGEITEAKSEITVCINAMQSGRQTVVGTNQNLTTLAQQLLKELNTKTE